MVYANAERLLAKRDACNASLAIQVQFIVMEDNQDEVEVYKRHWLATIAGNTLVVDHVPAHATLLGVPGTVLDVRVGSGRCAVAAPQPLSVPHADGDETLQQTLLQIFASVLGHESVAPQRNFFDAGGNSLKALQLCRLVNERLGVALDAIDLYRHPTVHDLVRRLRGSAPPVEAAQAGQRRAASGCAPASGPVFRPGRCGLAPAAARSASRSV